MRPIDADVLYKQLKHFGLENGSSLGRHSGIAEDFLHAIASAPTIDPESLRPQGEWIKVGTYRDEDGFLCYEYGCSLCNRIVDELEPYCPNCGAKMKTHN